MAKKAAKKTARPAKSAPKSKAGSGDEGIQAALVSEAGFDLDEVSAISTGILPWDAFFEVGGMPLGIFIELSSKMGLGKSTITGQIIRSLAEQGHKSVVMDAESGYNKRFRSGMKLDQHFFHPKKNKTGMVTYLRPRSMQAADKLFDQAIKMEGLRLIVVDSLTMLQPEKLLDKNIGEMQPGHKAILEGQLLARWKTLISNLNLPITVIFISQTRIQLNFKGVSAEKSAGSRAVGFACDVRMTLRMLESIKQKRDVQESESTDQKEVKVGNVLSLSAPDKSRWTHPGLSVRVPVYFGKGVRNVHYLTDLLTTRGFIKLSGSHYNVPEEVCGIKDGVGGNGRSRLWAKIGEKDCFHHMVDFAQEQGLFSLLYEDEDKEEKPAV